MIWRGRLKGCRSMRRCEGVAGFSAASLRDFGRNDSSVVGEGQGREQRQSRSFPFGYAQGQDDEQRASSGTSKYRGLSAPVEMT